jgi:hypothetical protein
MSRERRACARCIGWRCSCRSAIHGMRCMPATRYTGSTTRKPTAYPARSTRTTQRAFSAACAGLRSGIITTSPVRICFASRRKRHGAKIIGASRTGRRLIGSLPSRWRTSRASISADIGSGTGRQPSRFRASLFVKLNSPKIPALMMKIRSFVRHVRPYLGRVGSRDGSARKNLQ